MIPLKDDNPTNTFPFATIGIIIINLLVFLFEMNSGGQLDAQLFLFGAVPYRITHLEGLPVLITLLTALFFHMDIVHLAGNMLYLWVFGQAIEDKLGHLKFIYFYLICGIVASMGFIMLIPDSKLPLIGASGAISGVLGAYFLLYPESRIQVLVPLFIFWKKIRIQAFWFLLFWIILQLFFGTTTFNLSKTANSGGVGWIAHVIGFIAGALFLTIFSMHTVSARSK